ncbi:hypothetical protein Huta_0457 [Halorhabdus utahensis DSM 12940]|uniref:Uncharacterized protein n=2 Tax=Halorhabdus utahensis TaxID=146826 RepID=C7NS37_HALUD|nr:hypothetical protein Huta_0457 [Halorhabdus utahensis DSM 12940]
MYRKHLQVSMASYTRRTVLGLSVVTVAGFAGCGEDDGSSADTTTETQASATPTPEPTATSEPTPTQTPEPTPTMPSSLSIDHVRFCAEQPTGYRQYTEQPDQTYRPGDVVWIYLEPSTVGTEPAGDGERRFAYEVSWTIYTPDGEALDTITRTFERTVVESTDFTTVFLVLNFSPSMAFEPGSHRVEIDVRDTIAGNEASQTATFDVEPELKQASEPFEVPEILFTAGEATGYDEYTPQPNAEYGPTDTVWYYYEIQGMHYRETEDAIRTNISIFETLTGPEGSIWAENKIPVNNEFSSDTDPSMLYLSDRLSPAEQWDPGSYTITLEVTDGYVDETIEQTGTFTVVE